MNTETRTTTASLRLERRAGKDRPVITGYGIVFAPARSVDLGGYVEQVDRHAADASLRSGQEIKAYFNHSPSFPLGSTVSGTLRLTADSTGVRFEIDPPPTTWANDLLISLERGDVHGASFSFQTEVDEWSSEGQVQLRTLKKISIREIGPVSDPAYPSATSGIRALLASRGLDADRLIGAAPVRPSVTAAQRHQPMTIAQRKARSAEIAARIDADRRTSYRPVATVSPERQMLLDLRARRERLDRLYKNDPAAQFRLKLAEQRQERRRAEGAGMGRAILGPDGRLWAPE